ncbi:hypothetical protein SAVIM40S_05438 [Streptomyces avidinii]
MIAHPSVIRPQEPPHPSGCEGSSGFLITHELLSICWRTGGYSRMTTKWTYPEAFDLGMFLAVRAATEPRGVETRVGKQRSEVRLRLHRGQPGPQGPSRRQGSQPRRDDQPGSAGPSRLHHHHRGLQGLPRQRHGPGRAARRGQRPPCRPRDQDGQEARPVGRPAAGLRAFRCEVLDARHDGHRPEHRSLRRLREGPRLAGGQRALRVGLVPPPHPDVRQDRPGRRRRALRGGPRRGQGRQEGHRRHRPRRRRPEEAGHPLQEDRRQAGRPRVPAGRPRAARPRRRGRLQLVEHRPRQALPPPGAHPERPGHRGQRLLHGLRQPRPRLRHRRRLHPRPRQRPRGRLRRLPPERPGRGRRRGHPQHGAARGPGDHRQGLVRPAHDDHDDAGEPLQGSLRHRVHHRARPAVDAPDPRRQAHGGCGLPHRHAARGPGPDHRGRGPPARHGSPARAADVPALRRGREDRAARPRYRRLPGRGRRQGRLRLVHGRQVVPLRREGHPDPPRDQPGRPRRHDRLRGHPDLARRQDLARRRRRPRHGQDLCLRRRGTGRRHQAPPHDGRRHGHRRGRRRLHRRLHRQGLPR